MRDILLTTNFMNESLSMQHESHDEYLFHNYFNWWSINILTRWSHFNLWCRARKLKYFSKANLISATENK